MVTAILSSKVKDAFNNEKARRRLMQSLKLKKLQSSCAHHPHHLGSLCSSGNDLSLKHATVDNLLTKKRNFETQVRLVKEAAKLVPTFRNAADGGC
ncbi:hypothetical protein EV1_032536 [Malus domestica]